MTTEISNSQGVGYAGKHGQRAYLARVTGSDRKYGLAREFVSAARVERDRFGRGKYTRTYTYEIGPGLYEEQSEGDRRMILCWQRADGSVTWSAKISDERVRAMLALMDAGEDFEAARLATRPAKDPAPVSAEVQS